jgi:hypothetical protein
MYTEEIILKLADRIGFGTHQGESFAINISEANSLGFSKRFFKSFHALVTIENIFNTINSIIPNDSGSTEMFNSILGDFRIGATREVLPLIMDKNNKYKVEVDYSQVIEDNIILFDDAIGYKVAMMVLEMMISSSRSNLLERNAKLSASNLKLELEGFRNDTGILIANGLVHKLDKAIRKATNKIFPFEVIIESGNVW